MTGVLITLIAYQLLMLSIGWWASHRNTDSEDFYLGGRKLGGCDRSPERICKFLLCLEPAGCQRRRLCLGTPGHLVDSGDTLRLCDQLVHHRAQIGTAKPQQRCADPD